MAKRRPQKGVNELIAYIDRELRKFGKVRKGVSLRNNVIALARLRQALDDLGVSTLAEGGISAKGARERIKLYMREYVGEVIESVELEVVTGISEYARRIRELRVQFGYHIASGASPDPHSEVDLRPDQYILVDGEPDQDAARRWGIVNRIRRGKGGSKDKILQFLKENVGKVVTTEELAYVANKVKNYPRRIRELRTESGYSIATRLTGRPDLKVGQYVLLSAERIAEPHDRQIPDEIQKTVYERDKSKCKVCGWTQDRWSKRDPRILELHHLEHHKEKGSNREENLTVICSKCHDEVHSGKHRGVVDKIKKALCRTYSRRKKDRR